jgi:putative oxidoreductase
MKKRSAPAKPASNHDAAALLLRLTIGPMLIAHGYNKVFGPGGLEGTTRWFRSLGLAPPHVHARLAAATEIGAGSLLTLGAASPLPAAAAIGLMTTAARTDHKGKGLFVFKGGWEYTAVIAGVAAVIAALGPGRYSLDGLLGRQRSGMRWALAAAAIGVANSFALLATSYHPEPPADTLISGAEPETEPEMTETIITEISTTEPVGD